MRGRRGQVMVLGCLMMLVLALCMAMSFSVAHSVHERIRLQSYADASAYSMAVVEARAMNYIAYSNRAIAATFVSMATAHAYVAAANSAAFGPETGINAMEMAKHFEALSCFPRASPPCCIHAEVEIPIKSKLYELQKYLMMADRMFSIDKPLNKAVEGFVAMIQSIHKSQRATVERAATHLARDIFNKSGAPCAQVNGNHFKTLNRQQFACALESSPLDSECNKAMSPVNERKRIMTNVVHASRPAFISGSSLKHHSTWPVLVNEIYHESYVRKYLDTIPKPAPPGGLLYVSLEAYMADECEPFGGWASAILGGLSNFSDGINSFLLQEIANHLSMGGANQNSKGNMVCAKAGYQMMSFPQLIDVPTLVPGVNSMMATVGSGQSGQLMTAHSHSPISAEHLRHNPLESPHNKFKQMFNGSCEGNNAVCFINYRVGSEDDHWGQPLVFFVASQNLGASVKDNSCNEQALPWHINAQGQVEVEHGERPKGVLNMRPQKPGYAASQAMVYFHRTDTWRAPPNLFEPYWRAKLHPFKDRDFQKLMSNVSM